MCITLHNKKKKVSDLTVKELEDFIELVVQQAMFKHFSSDMPIGVMGNQGYFIEPKQKPFDGTIICHQDTNIQSI